MPWCTPSFISPAPLWVSLPTKNSKWYPITYGCISEAKTWLFPLNNVLLFIYHGPLVRYVKSRVVHTPGMPGAFSRPPWVSDLDMHHGTCVPHVPCCMSGALTNDFLWSWWRGKRSRHSRRMHKPQVHVSGKRPIPLEYITWSKVARLMGPTWGPSGADKTQAGPVLTPWILLLWLCPLCWGLQNQCLLKFDIISTYQHPADISQAYIFNIVAA